MCIRDRFKISLPLTLIPMLRIIISTGQGQILVFKPRLLCKKSSGPVSYTHLDLDSIKKKGFRAVIFEAGYKLPFKYLSEEWFKACLLYTSRCV